MTVADLTANDASITDYFTISIGHECSGNVLTLADPTDSQPDFEIAVSGDGSVG